MKIQNLFSVAAYIRLSREDGDKAESDSIGNQRKLISDYLKNKEDFILYDTYIDDGYTGTNFKRPAFKRPFTIWQRLHRYRKVSGEIFSG